MNILFTCAGRRKYLLEYFKKSLNGNGKIVAVDMEISAPALIAADKTYLVPEIYDANYINILKDICIKENIKLIISLNDLELPILSCNKKIFEKLGVQILLSDYKVIEICFDKWKTGNFANENKIKVPTTFLKADKAVQEVEAGKINYPLVVKPRWGSASIGIDYPEDKEELMLSYKLLDKRLNRTILRRVSEDDRDNSIIIQEKIIGVEYGVDILNDLNGKPVQVYVKEKLTMRAGETDKAVLVNNPKLEELGFKIGKILGHVGNLDCDFMFNGKDYYLLEMNPRFGGGYPFSHSAGADYPSAIVSWLKGKVYDFSSFKKKYGIPYAKCDVIIETLKEEEGQ